MPHEVVSLALFSSVQENFGRNSRRKVARKYRMCSNISSFLYQGFFLSFRNLCLGMSQNKIFLNLIRSEMRPTADFSVLE